ncbi:MAG: Vi polysaccharide biosynthesis protein VipA/TviB [Flavobacteriales bacterium]|nr:Vi polysaccharide biosynthesis protein VipA/TviB [Flavobacteriales bacterium]|tara:strand:+ start:1414 stop:2670 length:1257 start_codon:yes stop_codon:yes gene_type:complete
MKVKKIGVIGLGYVGLPLAVEFGKKYNTSGYDINHERISQLKKGIDVTKECNSKELKNSKYLSITSDINQIRDCNIYIVTVPTDIDKYKVPNLKPILNASRMIGSILKKDDIVIFESTVYPGCTEDECIPELEKASNLKYNIDFYCGYSPERINPGDKINTLTKIKKVTSGSNPQIAKFVDDLYKSIIEAGTFLASSIKVAEASKAIENAQRDLNISFVNELSLIFDRIGIDTNDVLEAASTKWNFLHFKPGLVGGHCIGVDPYYLAHKAESLGYYPEVILSGRRVNENMSVFVANKLMKKMINNNINIKKSKVLILGITFKENCPDIRNTKVIDVYNELLDLEMDVDVYDAHADVKEVKTEFSIDLINSFSLYDAIVLAVAHNDFKKLDVRKLLKNKQSIIFDLKCFLDRKIVDLRM